MSYSDQTTFTKENIDTYFRELAKEYRRLRRKQDQTCSTLKTDIRARQIRTMQMIL